MPADEDVRAAFTAVVTVGEPAQPDATAAIFARAGSLERRRRAWTAAAAAVAVAAVSVGVVAAYPREPAPAQVLPIAGPAPGAPVQPSVVSDPDAVLATLRNLLPVGTTTSHPEAGEGFARLTVTAAGRTGSLEVNVQAGSAAKRNPADTAARYDCGQRSEPQGTVCRAEELPDGTLLVTTDGPGDEPGATGVRRRLADTLTLDGTRIVVQVWNTTRTKKGAAGNTAPPLSVGQLTMIATDDQWKK